MNARARIYFCGKILRETREPLRFKEICIIRVLIRERKLPEARRLSERWFETKKAFIQGEDQRAASKNLPKITTCRSCGRYKGTRESEDFLMRLSAPTTNTLRLDLHFIHF